MIQGCRDSNAGTENITERFAGNILREMDACILIADRNKECFVYISENCESRLGITEEILCPDVDKSKASELLLLLGELLSEKEVADRREARVYNGFLDKYMWLRITAALIEEGTGRLQLFTLTDITFEHEQRERLQKELEAARSASREKSRFLSGMSHEIRTPMNVITGMTKLARANMEEKDKLSVCLDKMEYACMYLQELISDVLDMSQIESGRMNLLEEDFRLSHLLTRLKGLIEPQCEEKRQSLEFCIGQVEHDCLIGDELSLQRVFMNLLSNAVKYTQEGGRIRFCVREEKGPVRGTARYSFTVTDTGIGISADFMEHLFEPFQRERKNGNIEGSGLGLMICKSIVEAMGGRITVQSADGKGSSFTVETIMKLGKEKEAEKSGNLTACGWKISLTGKRILLVEDNRLNREMEADLLKLEGAVVETAENGEESVKKFLTSPPGHYDCILMDIRMPIMNGYEAAKAIRSAKRPDAARLPIIAMTADVFAGDIQAAKEAGMNAHLSKPVDLQRLRELLCSLL